MAKRKAEWQNNYISRRYDRINLLVDKGRKEEIAAHAKEQDESLNAFVNRAIAEAMEKDKNCGAEK